MSFWDEIGQIGQNIGTDPTMMGLLGMAGSAAQAGMPSRMPIPTGAALGMAAAGLGQGQQEAYKGQYLKQKAQAEQLANIGATSMLPVTLAQNKMLQQIYSDPALMNSVRGAMQRMSGGAAPMGIPAMPSAAPGAVPSVSQPMTALPGAGPAVAGSTSPLNVGPAASAASPTANAPWSLMPALPQDQQQMVQQAAALTGMPADLLANHKWNESRTSLAPAEGDGGASFGVMQMQGPTLDAFNAAHGTNYTTQQLKDNPQLALNVGAGHWMDLNKQYSNPFLASMAYARGPGKTDEWLKSGADFQQLPQGVREVLGNVYGPGSFPGASPVSSALFAARAQTPGAMGTPVQAVGQAGGGQITAANALEKAQQYEQQANDLDLLKSLRIPVPGDPATLRQAAQQFREVGLAGPKAAGIKAAELPYVGPTAAAQANATLPTDLFKQGFTIGPNGLTPIPGGKADPAYVGQVAASEALNKARNSNVELRTGGMAGMPQGNGQFNWVKNPELRTQITPQGATQDVYVSPPLPGSPPGTAGTAEPVLGPNGQPVVTKLPQQVTQGREHAVNEFLTKDQDAYQAAQNTQAWLNQIDSAADAMNKQGPAYMTGPFAPQRLALMAHVNDLASSMGINRPFNPSAVASWEEMKKATTTAGFELSSHYEGHARQAAQTIMNATSAVPAQTNSPQGIKLVSAGIREGAQSAMDTHEYKQAVYNATQGAGLEQAETDFYKTHPATQYANRAISALHPFSISDPKDIGNYLPGTFFTVPGKISQATGKPAVFQVPPRQETINGIPVTLGVPAYLRQAAQAQPQGAQPNAP